MTLPKYKGPLKSVPPSWLPVKVSADLARKLARASCGRCKGKGVFRDEYCKCITEEGERSDRSGS